MLLSSLMLGICILGWSQIEAATITVNADVNRTDLSQTNPIEFTVHFPVTFTSIELLKVDTFFVDDGLDGGERVAYSDLTGKSVPFGEPTLFFFRMRIPSALGFDLTPFLDGVFEGTIVIDLDPRCIDLGQPCNEDPTATYDRLVFTIDGIPTPEPATGALLILTSPLLFLCLRFRNQRHRNQGLRS